MAALLVGAAAGLVLLYLLSSLLVAGIGSAVVFLFALLSNGRFIGGGMGGIGRLGGGGDRLLVGIFTVREISQSK